MDEVSSVWGCSMLCDQGGSKGPQVPTVKLRSKQQAEMKGECTLGTGNSSAKVLRQEWAFCVPETGESPMRQDHCGGDRERQVERGCRGRLCPIWQVQGVLNCILSVVSKWKGQALCTSHKGLSSCCVESAAIGEQT